MVRGFLKISGAHFNSDATHAPVASDSSLLVMISLVLKHDLHFKELDVKTFFLDSPLAHEVWVSFLADHVYHIGVRVLE